MCTYPITCAFSENSMTHPNVLEFPLGAHPHSATYSQMVANLILSGEVKVFRDRVSKAFDAKTAKLLCENIDTLLGSREYRSVWRALAVAMQSQRDFDEV